MYGPPRCRKRKLRMTVWSAQMYSAFSGVKGPLAMMESARLHPYKLVGLEGPLPISGFERAGETGMPSQLSASRPGRKSINPSFASPLQPPPFPSICGVFRTARSCQGRAGFARRSEPLTARTVLEHGPEGKGASLFIRGSSATHRCDQNRAPIPFVVAQDGPRDSKHLIR
jgi:hypothetical protein